MDSFQNIFFSLLKFNHTYKSFPEEMVVISHEFKRARFEQLHFKAIKEMVLPTLADGIEVSWQGKPRFEGIDPEHMIAKPGSARAEETRQSEKGNGYDLWEKTPYGNSGVLLEKRNKRNAWNTDLSSQLVYAVGNELVTALEAGAELKEEDIDWKTN
jgi:hypothetical protein